MRSLALKWRLSILMALSIAGAMAIICAIAYEETLELILHQANQSLIAVTEDIEAIMSDPLIESDRRKVLEHLLTANVHGAPHLTRIWTGEMEPPYLATGSVEVQRVLVDRIRGMPIPTANRSERFDLTCDGKSYLVLWTRVGDENDALNILVAQSTSYLLDEIHELLDSLVFLAALVVAGLTVVSIAMVILVLRPIHRTAQRLHSVTAANVDEVELHSEKLPIELMPFLDSVRQMLQRLASAMRQQKSFIADAAHELRTPLAVARSTVELSLSQKRSAADHRQALLETSHDLGRLERLVEELLTLARIDGSAGLSDARPLELQELLEELTSSFSHRVTEKGGRLISRLVPACVFGNRSQLERLFLNLLDNALRHGPSGGPIELTMEIIGATVRVFVKDRGGLIPSEDLPHLFDRFRRADASRSRTTGGAGLGLAIAREITLRHGGEIVITSNPRDGTSVFVRLPLHDDRIEGRD